MTPPKLTICLPVYNGEAQLARVLESLLGQTHSDLIVDLVDNASTDGAEEVARRYQAADPRLNYYRNPQNRGLLYSYRRSLYGCSSPYWVMAPVDQTWEPGFAEEALAVLEADPEVCIVYPKVNFVGPEGELIETYEDCGFDQAQPADRYLNVLSHMNWCTPFLGIVRYEPFLKSYYRQTYIPDAHGDNLLLADIALRHKMVQLNGRLFNRIKGRHQTENESLPQRNIRLMQLIQEDEGQDSWLPFCNFIKHHCVLVKMAPLEAEVKDRLIKETVSLLKGRYQHMLESELTRAVDLILAGRVKQRWIDEMRPEGQRSDDLAPLGRYRYLDFSYLSHLHQELENAFSLWPDYPGLGLAKAVLLLQLGRAEEAAGPLSRTLKSDPTNRRALELKRQLETWQA